MVRQRGTYVRYGLDLQLWYANSTTIAKKYISLAGNFDGYGDAPVQYQAHLHMGLAQSFNLSHWTPQSVEYSLSIAPATAGVPYKQEKNTIKTNASHLLAILMAMAMRQYGTKHINQ